MPRPTKLTPQVQDAIVLALRAGNYLSVAARANGVSEATLHRWLRDPRRPYRDFARAVEIAIAEGEVIAVALIGKAKHPGVTAKMLARRHPERWGPVRDSSGGVVDSSSHEIPESPNPAQATGQGDMPTLNDRMVTLPPEWAFVLNRLMSVAARGRTPAEFFQGPDRFAALREDALPRDPWWKLSGTDVPEPTDGQ
jgi:hypothetical protein